MTACFGLNEGYALQRFPHDRLIESHARLDATMLNRIGALTDGAVTMIQCGTVGYRLATRSPNILIDGNPVLVVWTDWALPWFECPMCHRRCRHVYLLDPIACRRCCRLDFASRHVCRQTPAVFRVARLRRKLGADEHPFAPLPARRRGHTRAYHERLVQNDPRRGAGAARASAVDYGRLGASHRCSQAEAAVVGSRHGSG